MYDCYTGYNCRSRCGLDDVFGQHADPPTTAAAAAAAAAAPTTAAAEHSQNFLCSPLESTCAVKCSPIFVQPE